jgi:gas vesicle protein
VPSIQTGKIETDRPEQGLASVFRADSAGGRVGAGAVGRLLGSKTGRRLIEKIGVDPEQADLVQLVSEIAIGFSVGGPGGALVPLARRGGRDVADKALEIMVERGWVEQEVADKITKYGLNRIASEGLPDEILKAAEVTKDKLLTEDSKRKALEIGSTLQERSLELTEAARERATELTGVAKEQASELAGRAKEQSAELAERAKEQTSEIVGRIGDRWKRRRDRDSEPLVSDPFSSDPFSSPPDPQTSVSYDDPFADSGRGGLASTSEKEVKASAKRITKNFTVQGKPRKKPADRGELVRRAVPTTASDLFKIIEESPYMKGKKSKEEIYDLINMMEVDWPAMEKLSLKLDKVLADSPAFEELLGEYDIPLMLVTKQGAKKGAMGLNMFGDKQRWNSIEGEYMPEHGFIAFPSRIVDQEIVHNAVYDGPLPTDDIIRHELSHTIHAMAMAQSRKARKAYEKDTADFIRRAEEGLELAEQRGDDVFNMASVSMSYEDSALAGEISRYAQSKRAEYIAELLTHMLPGKKTKYVNIKDEHFEMLSEFLDIPVSRLRELYRKSMDNRTGWL